VIAGTIDSADAFRRIDQIFGERYKLEHLVAASSERLLFVAFDRLLGRHVSLRANLDPLAPARTWFLREAEALGQLDHPAIRHVYDAGLRDEVAFRVGNWVDGESLFEAAQRGPRLLPLVLTLARDLLSALEHAHANGIIVRRVVPQSLVVTTAGRAVMTDLRYSSWTLPSLPAGEQASGSAYMAPEVRDGSAGDPTSDVYTAGAVLYFAITGIEPPLEPAAIRRPSTIRPTTPRTLERVVLRALSADPDDRYLTAAEMFDDLASDAGTSESPAYQTSGIASQQMAEDGVRFEKRLRRALGDDYELLMPLGRGAFGRVYKVRDLHLEREVALKVLHPHLTLDPTIVERFRREAQLAAKLQHPFIANVFDISGRSGLLWYTMEFVNGPSLAQLVERRGPLPVEQVVDFLHQALEALDVAHRDGVVHRDLKPENLLVAPDGTIRLTDFGLAMALRGGRFGSTTSQSGTPMFAAPEQLLGEKVDVRTDLYSLAAVAYFALLGEPPFRGPNPESILGKQVVDRVPSLARLRTDVPPELEAVLMRAIRSAPEARFPSAAAFADALEQALRGTDSQTGLAALAARWLGLPSGHS
jgi:serine/threonine-protein kinase